MATTQLSLTGITYSDSSSDTTGIVYSPTYTYPDTNIQRVWAHGMGQRPRQWGAVIILTTTQNSTPAGTAFAFTSYDGDAGRQNSVFADTTNVGYIGSHVYVRGFDTNNIEMTPSNAQIYFWARK